MMESSIRTRIENWRTRGAIAPSSKFLVKRMISKIDFEPGQRILQLGYGRGVFTRGLLQRMTHDSEIVAFEVDPECLKHQIRDRRLIYIQDSAQHIHQYYPQGYFDHIVSTLPFASLPKPICDEVFEQIRLHLKPEGKFLQYQYSLHSRKDIKALFNRRPDIDFEVLNLPPAFIYETQKAAD